MSIQLEIEKQKLEYKLKKRNQEQRRYYQLNKKAISEKNKEKIKNAQRVDCPCGGKYKNHSVSIRQHSYTKRHFKWLMSEHSKQVELKVQQSISSSDS